MQAVWGTVSIGNGSLDTLVNTLREKFDARQPRLLSTVRGGGYSLLEDPEPPKPDIEPRKISVS